MKKIDRKTFEATTEVACVIAEEMAVAAATFGIAFCGVTTTMMRPAEKHPKIVRLVASIAAGAVTNVVAGIPAIGGGIATDSGRFARHLTNLIYGPSDEEETED